MSGSVAPVRYTIPPNIHSLLTVQTKPNAVCTVQLEGESDPSRSLKIYADDNGIARFHVRPSGESRNDITLVVKSVSADKTVHHPVHLRSSHTTAADMPAPPPEHALAFRRGLRVRPPLSVEEAMKLTDEQAIERGYPLPPHPELAPRAFQSWLRAVSMSAHILEPHVVSNPDLSHGKAIQHGPATSSNWSGFELDRNLRFTPQGVGLTEPYDWVTGTWHVPSVISERNQRTYSAFWVGLDGDGTTDLVQAGTEQDSLNIDVLFLNITLSSYYAWTEFLPQQPTEQVITNFVVNPGDEILTDVWLGNAGSGPTLSGAFGFFLIMNLSTGVTASYSTPVGSTKVGGGEAVWIMERPTLSGNVLPDLADYSSAVMYNAMARKANSPRHQGYVGYQGARNKQITMFNGADTLSTVSPIDAYSMRFNWQAFK